MLLVIMSSCYDHAASDFTRKEKLLINGNDSLMRVLDITNKKDSLTLRKQCHDISEASLLSEEYARLAEKMIYTVTHPSQDGVGIAGPQVGLNRRIVAVQRFDKEGEPFEVYANIRISNSFGEKVSGPEGCLSVPQMRGDVMRNRRIEIEYDYVADDGTIKKVKETVSGFTAVIFQHETDHLDGILYIDKIQ